jgi:hypothetical protein
MEKYTIQHSRSNLPHRAGLNEDGNELSATAAAHTRRTTSPNCQTTLPLLDLTMATGDRWASM